MGDCTVNKDNCLVLDILTYLLLSNSQLQTIAHLSSQTFLHKFSVLLQSQSLLL